MLYTLTVCLIQDLREECIKLKMLVFDLERQNRALCELFQQKLPNHPTTHYQVNDTVFNVTAMYKCSVVLPRSRFYLHSLNQWE